jgi:magnesium chelatase family protein
VVDGLDVYGFSHIKEIISFLEVTPFDAEHIDIQEAFRTQHHYGLDFSDVKGQQSIKRCMEIAAAGGHNIILIGPPGSGKTMLAKRLLTILPPMELEEALETTKIHSVVGGVKDEGLMRARPFRSPHHTISDVALVGGVPIHNQVKFLSHIMGCSFSINSPSLNAVHSK